VSSAARPNPSLPRLLGALVLAGAALGAASATWADEAREPDAARGLAHLLETPFVPAGFDQEVFENLWRVWPEDARERARAATPAERQRMAFARYGLTPRPGVADGPPLQFVVAPDGAWHMSCFACHAGQVAGRTIPGLPNAHLALQTLVDETRATKRKLGRPPRLADLAVGFIPFGETVGTTNAVVFSFALLQWRDRDLNRVLPWRIPRLPHHDLDAPPWWHYARRTHLYIDGFGKKGHRTPMQFVLDPSNDRDAVLRHEDAFRDIERYLESVQAPTYPFPVDEALARRGQRVFEAACASCHGAYGEGGRYPNRLVPIELVGTDRVRLDAITPEERTIYADSWLTGYEPAGVRTDPGGYVAPPLDGIWASAPYFHNGAVPTLWHVLHPQARPGLWRRHPTAYDTERVGLEFDVAEALPADADAHELRRWFDTRRHGKSAAGHTFPDRLSAAERRSLLEYLKTL
jgi:mono/diheme cytochrome c family protein